MALQNLFGDLALESTSRERQELLQILYSLLNICEPLGTRDSNNRQRIVIENSGGFGYSVTGNTAGGNPYAITSGQPTQVTATIIDQRWELCEHSQNNFHTSVRSKLTWS